MALATMYAPKSNSPKTELAADITAVATSMTVVDGNCLPAAPNIAVLGTGENAEVVIYNSKSGNTLSGLLRGSGGTTASVWPAETVVARNFTAADHQALIDNINDLSSSKADSSGLGGIQVRPDYIVSTTDIQEGDSLPSGKIYIYYEAS